MDEINRDEALNRGWDPALLDSASQSPEQPEEAVEEKGWISRNPYRAAFVGLLIVVVGGVAGLFMALNSSGGGAPPGPPAQLGAQETVSEAEPAPDSFGTGMQLVGTDVEPGVYRNVAGSSGCAWERLERPIKGSEDRTAVIESDFDYSGEQMTVEIMETDAAFYSAGCQEWVRVG